MACGLNLDVWKNSCIDSLSCGIINVASTFSCEIWSNLVEIGGFWKKGTPPGVKISEETPQLLLKYQQQKTQLPKKASHE